MTDFPGYAAAERAWLDEPAPEPEPRDEYDDVLFEQDCQAVLLAQLREEDRRAACEGAD